MIEVLFGESEAGSMKAAKRIDYFIQTGKIKIVEDSGNHYARTICLA